MNRTSLANRALVSALSNTYSVHDTSMIHTIFSRNMCRCDEKLQKCQRNNHTPWLGVENGLLQVFQLKHIIHHTSMVDVCLVVINYAYCTNKIRYGMDILQNVSNMFEVFQEWILQELIYHDINTEVWNSIKYDIRNDIKNDIKGNNENNTCNGVGNGNDEIVIVTYTKFQIKFTMKSSKKTLLQIDSTTCKDISYVDMLRKNHDEFILIWVYMLCYDVICCVVLCCVVLFLKNMYKPHVELLWFWNAGGVVRENIA